MHMVSSARAVFPLHTLIMVAFWRPWVCTFSYWTVVLMCRVRRDCSSCEGLDALSSISGISPLYILSFPDSAFIAFSCHVLAIIYLLSLELSLYVLLQCSFNIMLLIMACSGYFRLSVYTWGIFLAYMRRHNVSVSIGSGRYKWRIKN